MLTTRVLLLAALCATLFAQEKKEEKKEEKKPAPAQRHAAEPASRPAESRPSEASRPAEAPRVAPPAPAYRQPASQSPAVDRAQPQPSNRQPAASRPDEYPSNRSATPAERNSPAFRSPAVPSAAPAASPRVVRGPSGAETHYGPRGEVREVRNGNMVIAHGPAGYRRVEVARPDGRVIVANGMGRGYVQRPFVFRNTPIVQRTYYMGGRSFVSVYRPFVFRGISINVYVPTRYYAPAFYGYVYNPWARPVVFSWGWAAARGSDTTAGISPLTRCTTARLCGSPITSSRSNYRLLINSKWPPTRNTPISRTAVGSPA